MEDMHVKLSPTASAALDKIQKSKPFAGLTRNAIVNRAIERMADALDRATLERLEVRVRALEERLSSRKVVPQ